MFEASVVSALELIVQIMLYRARLDQRDKFLQSTFSIAQSTFSEVGLGKYQVIFFCLGDADGLLVGRSELKILGIKEV